jgi:uncharacterized integral membrane protein
VIQFFFSLAFLLLLGVLVFAFQNSRAPVVDIRFFIWKIRTSPALPVLASLASGMISILLLWIPLAFRSSLQKKNLKREIEDLKREKDIT